MSNRKLRSVPIVDLHPSEENIRLFVADEDLESLVKTYRAMKEGEDVVPPPPPIVNGQGDGAFEILAGERRVTAAWKAGLGSLEVLVGDWDLKEAYQFIALANEYEPITTVEKAYRAHEMKLRGFSHEEIREVIGDVNPARYIRVGSLVDPGAFTDAPKECDPPITWWYAASELGKEHFDWCFAHWDLGEWGEAECSKNFRLTGEVLPLDNAKKGLRVSVGDDGRVLRLRGQIDLDMYTEEDLRRVVAEFELEFHRAVDMAKESHHLGFGKDRVVNINPETVGW